MWMSVAQALLMIIIIVCVTRKACERKRQPLSWFYIIEMSALMLVQVIFYLDYLVFVFSWAQKECLVYDRILYGVIDFLVYNMAMMLSHKYYQAARQIYSFAMDSRLPTEADEANANKNTRNFYIVSFVTGILYLLSAWFLTSKEYFNALKY